MKVNSFVTQTAGGTIRFARRSERSEPLRRRGACQDALSLTSSRIYDLFPMSEHGPPQSLRQLRAEWRERLQSARDRAAAQVDEMGLADLRALRATIEEEMERVEARLPDPGPVETKGPITAEQQAEHVQAALQYHALQVRKQLVTHELRRRAFGPAALEQEIEVPPTTRHYATLAWEVMAEADVDTTAEVYREVARRADEDVHLTTVEEWLREKNPHHPEETDGRWTELRRAVLLASA